MTSAIGVLESASSTGFFAAAVTASRNRNPRTPEASTACHIARGTTRSGSWVSSARFAADSNPTMVNAPSSVPSRNGPDVRGRSEAANIRGCGIAPLLNRLCERQVPGDHADYQQQHDERDHSREFGADREVVDPLRPPRRVRHQQRLHEQHHPGDDPRVRRGPGVVDQVGRDRGGDRVVDRDRRRPPGT